MLETEQSLNIESTGWTTFLSILIIIAGGFYCITIIGAVFGVPLILIGLKFYNGAKYAKELKFDSDINTATKSINEFNGAFKIYGILLIVAVSIWLVFMILAVTLGIFGALGSM